MGEVVDNDHARGLSDHFEAPPHAPERGQRLQHDLGIEAIGPRRDPDRRPVCRVVFAPHPELDPLPGACLFQLEGDAVLAALDRTGEPDIARASAVGHHAARARPSQPLDGRVVGAGDQEPARRQPLDQPDEGPFQPLEVGIEIDVVVLQAGQDHGLRPVVPELRSAVEVGGVVLVPLDREARAAAEREAGSQADGRAADEETGIGAGARVDPGRHRGRRRLAVAAGDDQRVPVPEHEAVERFGHRQPRQAEFLGRHRLRVGARDRVADDDQVRSRRQVGRVVADHGLDARVGQQLAGRRIEGSVGSPHLVAQLPQQAGERRHAGAADRDQVDVQGGSTSVEVGPRDWPRPGWPPVLAGGDPGRRPLQPAAPRGRSAAFPSARRYRQGPGPANHRTPGA